MDAIGLSVIAGMFVLFGVLSKRIDVWPVTPPLLFIAFGLLISSQGLSVVHLEVDHAVIHTTAEFTLIVLSGALVAIVMFPGLTVFDVLLLAAILAPSDAALGQAVVTNPAVLEKIREALSVESGVKDGIALLAVVFLAACASAAGHSEAGLSTWLWFGATQIVLGPLIGTRTPMRERLFIGWFGLRGLVSILFGLLIVERSDIANADLNLTIVVATVAMSAILHGITANPLARLIGRPGILQSAR